MNNTDRTLRVLELLALSEPRGMYGSDFHQYNLYSFFKSKIYWLLSDMVELGLVREEVVDGADPINSFSLRSTLHHITNEGRRMLRTAPVAKPRNAGGLAYG